MALVTLNMTVNGNKVSVDVESDARLVDCVKRPIVLNRN